MHWQFGEMEFGEMKRNTSNWSNFCMLLRRAGLTASAGLSCQELPLCYNYSQCLGFFQNLENLGVDLRYGDFDVQSWVGIFTVVDEIKF